MGKEIRPLLVKLVFGVLFSDEDRLKKAKKILTRKFGKIDFESDPMPYFTTSYYDEEMGTPITRAFFSFAKLIHREDLVKIKRFTNRLEIRLSEKGKRRINLDPGFLSEGKFVLATTKNHQHRIYIRRGIFYEITLKFSEKKWQPNPWTYRDYASEEYRAIFKRIRRLYVRALNDSGARKSLHYR